MPRVDPVNAASAERRPPLQRADSLMKRSLSISRASDEVRREKVQNAAEVVRQTQTEGRAATPSERGTNLDVLA